MILKTIKCKKCNNEILDTNKFCPECGEKISGNKESSWKDLESWNKRNDF